MEQVQTQYIPPSPVTVGTFSVTGNDSTVQFTHTIPAGYTYSMCQIQDSQTGFGRSSNWVMSSHISGTTLYVDIVSFDGADLLPLASSVTTTVFYTLN